MGVDSVVSGGIVGQTATSLSDALMQLAISTLSFIPNLIAAVIIVAIGWFIGSLLKQAIVIPLLQRVKVDQWIEEQNLSKALGHYEVSRLLGSFVKWYVIAVFLAQAAQTFDLQVLGTFLLDLARFIPQVLVAFVIFAIGVLLARYVRNAVESTKHSHKKTVGLVIEIAVIYLAIVVSLGSVGIEVQLLEDLFRIAFSAFVLTIAIVAGISFGLAFKDDAKKMLKGIWK